MTSPQNRAAAAETFAKNLEAAQNNLNKLNAMSKTQVNWADLRHTLKSIKENKNVTFIESMKMLLTDKCDTQFYTTQQFDQIAVDLVNHFGENVPKLFTEKRGEIFGPSKPEKRKEVAAGGAGGSLVVVVDDNNGSPSTFKFDPNLKKVLIQSAKDHAETSQREMETKHKTRDAAKAAFELAEAAYKEAEAKYYESVANLANVEKEQATLEMASKRPKMEK